MSNLSEFLRFEKYMTLERYILLFLSGDVLLPSERFLGREICHPDDLFTRLILLLQKRFLKKRLLQNTDVATSLFYHPVKSISFNLTFLLDRKKSHL